MNYDFAIQNEDKNITKIMHKFTLIQAYSSTKYVR